MKRVRTPKTEVDTLQEVSFCFKKGHCEHQRNEFLQVWLVGMRQSSKKKVLKRKDGERHIHFASCPPEMQAGLRETRHAELKKWMIFNAGRILKEKYVNSWKLVARSIPCNE